MSDMRDIGRAQEPAESSFVSPANPDFRSEKISLEGEGLENSDIRPLDENSAMEAFHAPEADVSTNSGKLVGALAVALILGSAGVFAYTTGMHAQKPVNSAALPHPAAPPKVAAAAPPAPPPTPPAASDNSQQAAMATPTAPVSEPSKPVKTARLHTERSHLRKRHDDMTPASPTPEQSAMVQPSAPITPAPQQSAQAQSSAITGANQAPVPPPVSPTAPSSAYANNVPAPVITPDNGAAQVTPAPQPVVPETTTPSPQTATPSPQTATPEAQATPSPLPTAPETQAQNQATPQPAPTQSTQSGQIAPEQNPPQQQQAQ